MSNNRLDELKEFFNLNNEDGTDKHCYFIFRALII